MNLNKVTSSGAVVEGIFEYEVYSSNPDTDPNAKVIHKGRSKNKLHPMFIKFLELNATKLANSANTSNGIDWEDPRGVLNFTRYDQNMYLYLSTSTDTDSSEWGSSLVIRTPGAYNRATFTNRSFNVDDLVIQTNRSSDIDVNLYVDRSILVDIYSRKADDYDRLKKAYQQFSKTRPWNINAQGSLTSYLSIPTPLVEGDLPVTTTVNFSKTESPISNLTERVVRSFGIVTPMYPITAHVLENPFTLKSTDYLKYSYTIRVEKTFNIPSSVYTPTRGEMTIDDQKVPYSTLTYSNTYSHISGSMQTKGNAQAAAALNVMAYDDEAFGMISQQKGNEKTQDELKRLIGNSAFFGTCKFLQSFTNLMCLKHTDSTTVGIHAEGDGSIVEILPKTLVELSEIDATKVSPYGDLAKNIGGSSFSPNKVRFQAFSEVPYYGAKSSITIPAAAGANNEGSIKNVTFSILENNVCSLMQNVCFDEPIQKTALAEFTATLFGPTEYTFIPPVTKPYEE